jgi:hypothetical protein
MEQHPTFREWLQAKHPTCWQHYVQCAKRLSVPTADMSSHMAAAVNKTARKLRQWAIETGQEVPDLVQGAQQLALDASYAAGRYGTIKERQRATVALLAAHSALCGRVICSLRFDEVESVSAKIDSVGAAALGRWVLLRERVRAIPRERRRQRVREEWATSPYVFPSPSGGPSRFSSVKRAALSSACRPVSGAA